ncbi:MAG: phosphoribosylanthranilate isomerase [Sulfurospirillaceae bacterium]|jgi:phosphoribosylanthranilate isomerase
MRVKICGITKLEDAQVAIECGADALGFVFYEKSPRYITPKAAKEIIKNLPPFVEKVGLFVNEKMKNIDEISFGAKLTLAQLHWEVSLDEIKSLKTPYLQVVRAKNKEDIFKLQDEYRLVDAFVKEYGGVGKKLDLSWFDEIDCRKIILAGGLETKDLKELKKMGFYAVDVSSGVEKSKGIKDHKKIEEFIRALKG